MKTKARSSGWRGTENKSIKLAFNNVIPVFHSRLLQETEIRCGCGDKLEPGSEFYSFRIEPKDSSKRKSYGHFGTKCGREVIRLSNQINGTDYDNVYFMDTEDVHDDVIRGYGLHHYERNNNPVHYTSSNKTYLVAIYILCNAWNRPYPLWTAG